MTGEDIRKLLREQPFKPFVIHILETKAYAIKHIDWILLNSAGTTAALLDETDGNLTWVDVRHITRITQLEDEGQGVAGVLKFG